MEWKNPSVRLYTKTTNARDPMTKARIKENRPTFIGGGFLRISLGRDMAGVTRSNAMVPRKTMSQIASIQIPPTWLETLGRKITIKHAEANIQMARTVLLAAEASTRRSCQAIGRNGRALGSGLGVVGWSGGVGTMKSRSESGKGNPLS